MVHFHFHTHTVFTLFIFPRNIACSVAGITSDANVLTNYLRQAAQRLVVKWLAGRVGKE